MSTVSVVVVTHNSADTVQACLRSVAAAFHPANGKAAQVAHSTPYEILIIDTESSDETVSIVQAEARTLPITLLRVPNRGFGSAANFGGAQATGDVLWFLNPDAVVPPRCSERLLQSFTTPRVVAVAGALTNRSGGTTEVYGEPFPSFRWYVRRRFRVPRTQNSHLKTPHSVPWLSAASLLVRADAFRAIGGFSEKYFLYYEDVDLSRRLRAVGGALLLDPAVCVEHAGGQSAEKRDRLRASDRAEDQYFRAYRPFLERILLWPFRFLLRARWDVLLPSVLLGGALFGTPGSLTLPAVLTGMLTVFAVITRAPDLGATLLLFSLVAGQSIRPPLGTTTVTLTDLLLPLVVGAWLVRAMRQGLLSKPKGMLWWVMPLFLVVIPGLLLATERLPLRDWLSAIAYAVRLFLLFLLIPLAARVLQRPRRIPSTILGVSALLALLGLVQWRFSPSTTDFLRAVASWIPVGVVSPQGWDPHYGRVFSTWLDPNLLGGIFVLGVALVQTLPSPQRLLGRLAVLGGGFLVLTALILTKSRTALLAFGMVLAASAIVARPWRRLAVLTVGLALGLILTPSVVSRLTTVTHLDPTAALRVLSWQQALEQTRRAPVFGLGYNTYGFEQRAIGNIQKTQPHSWAGADSSPLTFLATTGVWGATLLCVLLLRTLWILLRRGRRLSGRSAATVWTARAALLGLLGIFVHAQFVQSLVYIHLAVPLALLLGSSLADPRSPGAPP